MKFINSSSIKLRFAVSLGSNALRALISFATGLLIARTLNPAGYGDLMFLLGSFAAIKTLLDMGASNAFFTFISQRARCIQFYLVYFSWLLIQLIVTLLLLWMIIPSSLFDKIWLGHDRGIVVLAFLAVFMQQQVWQTVGQIGEAMRKTVKVQLMNLIVALLYFMTVLVVFAFGWLSIVNIFIIILMQYIVATIFAYFFLRKDREEQKVAPPLSEILLTYWKYCSPLIILAIVSFLYDFSDKWMLQKFGGSKQQGYFQISSQFAAISLLATTSILSIFWKEIADAWEKQDKARVALLYHKVTRGLVMLGAFVSGLLLPWSGQIVTILLGTAYTDAWPVFAIMLFYPIHQSMGQIGGTMFLASGRTRLFMLISIIFMLFSIPITYLVLAPGSYLIPGLELGALGMAFKMVLLGIITVNIQAWYIARYGGWTFDWVFQAVGIPLMVGSGFISKMLAEKLWDIRNIGMLELISPVLFSSILYITIVISVIWWLPWLAGSNRGEIVRLLRRATFK